MKTGKKDPDRVSKALRAVPRICYPVGENDVNSTGKNLLFQY
jgi:hypothetical protein